MDESIRANEPQLSYEELLKSYQQLDENARALVRTDLELHKTAAELDTQVHRLLVLNKLSDEIHASPDPKFIFKTVCDSLIVNQSFEKSWSFYQEHGAQASLLMESGTQSTERLRLVQVAERCLALPSAQQTMLFTTDTKDHDDQVRGLMMSLGITQLIYAPIRLRGHYSGGLFAARLYEYPKVGEQDLAFFSMLGRQIGIAIDNANMTIEINQSNAVLEERVALRSRELVEANARLMELDRIKSNFISLVSHELRTPMTAIKGFVSLLLDFEEKVSVLQRRSYLQKIGEESDRLSRLIGDLLNVSRIESGRIVMRWNEVKLAALIDKVFERQRVQKAPVEYRGVVSESLPRFAADLDKLEQILINLVTNATRFTPEGGTISVVADRYEEGIRIRVINPGPGISFDHLNKIFDKFFRVENDVNRRHRGTGLGLSICRALVDIHGGKIWVDSEVNQTTTFTVLLPINWDKLESQSSAANEVPSGRELRGA